MKPNAVRAKFVMTVAAVVVTTAASSNAWSQATVDESPRFEGPAACVDCHDKPNPLRPTDLCLLTESNTWLNEDKHSQSHKLLGGELGQAMARRLGYDVMKDQRCLSCHSNWLRQDIGKGPPAFFDLGVTCESCHGPSSKWLMPHTKLEWRLASPVDKAAMGMVDVRHPVMRARQCFGCHMGDWAEGKFVTHEMYAAGHPPLPGIELATFAQAMVPHWRHLPEKGNFQNKEAFLAANFPALDHDPTKDLPRTRAVLLGGAVALETSVRLLVQSATESAEMWPELSLFQCAACHHDLQAAESHEPRTFGSPTVGRPPLPLWPTALVNVGIRHAAGDDQQFQREQAEFNQLYDDLRTAVAARPFGSPTQVATAGVAVQDWLAKLISRLAIQRYEEPDARRAILLLSRSGAADASNFHSARQIAWAIKVMLAEAASPYPAEYPPSPASGESREQAALRQAEDLRIWQQWQEAVWLPNQRKVDTLFQRFQLNDALFLTLPAGQTYKIEEALPRYLRAIAEYDRQLVQEQMGQLAERLERSN